MLVGDLVKINEKDKGIKKHLRGQVVTVTEVQGKCFCFELDRVGHISNVGYILPMTNAEVVKGQWCIERPINGIFLNPNETCLDENGEVLVFETIGQARQFIIDAGNTPEDVDHDLDSGALQINEYNGEELEQIVWQVTWIAVI